MGKMFIAKCKCGFVADFISGGSMINYNTVCIAPAVCSECGIFLKENYIDKPIICAECSKEIKFYNDPEVVKLSPDNKEIFNWNIPKLQDDFKLYEKNNYCPECKQYFLEFIDNGCFD